MSSVFSAVHERKFRRDPRDFSRGGPLDPKLLTTLLLYMIADANRRGYQLLLDAFWDEARAHGLPLPTVDPLTAASFCAARHKITAELLAHMLHEIAAHPFWDERGDARRWNGRRVFAVDGTKINLQRSADLDARFGTPDGAHCPQVLMSVLLDVCTKTPIDVTVSSFLGNERDHLFSMFESLEPGDILVLDRGYPSHEVFQALNLSKVDFVVRVPTSNTFGIVDEFRESDTSDRMFRLMPPEGSPAHWVPLDVRLVRTATPDGGESYFITSLRRSEFSLGQLRGLYHLRWEVEEFFKLLKGPYIGQGQFRSKSPSGVLQEIHALVLLLALTRMCMCAAAERTDHDRGGLSQKAAILGVASYVTRILMAPEDVALRELDALLQRIARPRYVKRTRRSFPRRSFRPALRWTSSGRRGD